jgi:hypothetical protein
VLVGASWPTAPSSRGDEVRADGGTEDRAVRLSRSEKMRREGEVAADEFQVRRMGRMGVL